MRTTCFRLMCGCGVFFSLLCLYFVVQLMGVNVEEAKSLPLATGNCQSAEFWSPISQTPSDFVTDKSWGSYRPDIYFGLKTRTIPTFFQSGIMWHNARETGQSIRHEVQHDELSKLQWIRNDGKHFGVESLIDRKLGTEINATFVVPEKLEGSIQPSWTQSFQISRTVNEVSSFIFYIGIENVDNDKHDLSSILVSNCGNSLCVVGKNSISHWFGLEVRVLGQKEDNGKPEVTYVCSENRPNNMRNYIQQHKSASNKKKQQVFEGLNKDGSFSKSKKASCSYMYFQTQSAFSQLIEVVLFEHVFVETDSAAEAMESFQDILNQQNTHDTLVSASVKFTEDFDKRFDALFQGLQQKSDHNEDGKLDIYIPTSVDMEAMKRSISDVVGGIGDFYGVPEIGDSSDVTEETAREKDSAASGKSKAVHLHCSTPSRTSFPRGFLWDEGFHQLVVSKWDPTLTMDVISSWMRTQFVCDESEDLMHSLEAFTRGGNESGWIPREMILGDDARSRVPAEFMVQHVDIANPPTLLLAVESLIRPLLEEQRLVHPVQGAQLDVSGEEESIEKHEYNALSSSLPVAEQEKIDVLWTFLKTVYPSLHRWSQWFIQSQSGPKDGTCRWRGRPKETNRLQANTLASGLDDYPRAMLPSDEEYHVDCLSWVIKLTSIMGKLSSLLHKEGSRSGGVNTIPLASHAAWYSNTSLQLLSALHKNHWDETTESYLDVGINDENGVFTDNVVCRCSADNGDVLDVPVPMKSLQSRQKNPDKLCPHSHPRFMYPMGDGQGGYLTRPAYNVKKIPKDVSFVPRTGYVNIFPFVLKLLPVSSSYKQIMAMLRIIESETLLGSPFGLRSIAKTDRYYKRGNAVGDEPYWRGPIWVPVNYLALDALHYYSHPERQTGALEVEKNDKEVEHVAEVRKRCLIAYHTLRSRLLRTVLSEFHRTGVLWEQYDDSTGRGMRGHPFTGWTTLIVNILSESYD